MASSPQISSIREQKAPSPRRDYADSLSILMAREQVEHALSPGPLGIITVSA
jgi:hypothetical protein